MGILVLICSSLMRCGKELFFPIYWVFEFTLKLPIISFVHCLLRFYSFYCKNYLYIQVVNSSFLVMQCFHLDPFQS